MRLARRAASSIAASQTSPAPHTRCLTLPGDAAVSGLALAAALVGLALAAAAVGLALAAAAVRLALSPLPPSVSPSPPPPSASLSPPGVETTSRAIAF